MPGPRLTHVLLFVCDLERMAAFYGAALGFVREASEDEGFVILRAASGAAIALHGVSAEIAAEIDLQSPPRWREDTACKLCFEVDDLEAARQAVLDAGGQAKAPWTWAGSWFCECADAEGNAVQLVVRPG